MDSAGASQRPAAPSSGDRFTTHPPAPGSAPVDADVGARGRDVADLELERFEAAEPPAREAGDDVEPIAFLDGLGDVGSSERDPVEHVALALEGQLAVAAGGGSDAGHREPEDGDERIGVPRTARREGRQLAMQAVVDLGGRQGEVDREGEARVARRPVGGERQEPRAERIPAVGRELEPGSAGMAAVADEQVAAFLERGAEIERAVAPARRTDDVAEVRPDDRGQSPILGQPGGDEADDPDAPGAAHDGRTTRRVVVRDGGPRLGDGRLHQVASGQVRRFEGVGVGRGLGRIVGKEEPGGLEGLPHPSRGIQSRRDGERDGLEVDGVGRDPRPFEEGRDAGPRRPPQALEAEPGDRAVLADDRRDVGDGPDGRQVGQVEGGHDPAGLVGQQELGDLERDAAAGQPAIRVGRVGPVRVDDGDRSRHDRPARGGGR